MRSLESISIRPRLQVLAMLTGGVALHPAAFILAGYDRVRFSPSPAQVLSATAKTMAGKSTAAPSSGDGASPSEIVAALQANEHVLLAAIYASNRKALAKFSRGTACSDFSPSSPPSERTAIIDKHKVKGAELPCARDRTRERLGQILVNLAGNRTQFTGPGEVISYPTTKPRSWKEIELHLKRYKIKEMVR